MTLFEYFQSMKDKAVQKLISEVDGFEKDFWTERKEFAEKVMSHMTLGEAGLKIDGLSFDDYEQIVMAA